MQAPKRTLEENRDRLLGEYLRAQRSELGSYLKILARQAAAIDADETETLARCISLESESIARLEQLRLASLAISTGRGAAARRQTPALKKLRDSLLILAREALARNAANRSALAARMAELRLELASRPTGRKRGSQHLRSPYARIARPTLVDIHR
jgi:hypothetical protein